MVAQTRKRPATTEAGVREAALAAATRLFAARGFDATPLQAIADEIGTTKQAILHHFPSKDLLREAVFEAMLQHWRETMPRLLVASASEDRFDAVFGEMRRFFSDDPDRARLVVREVLDRPQEIQRLLRESVRGWVATIAGYIRDGQATGRHYADADPEAYLVHMLYFVVTAAAAAAVTHGAIEPTASGRQRFDRELVRIAKAALFVPRAAPTKARKKRQS
jgi:TetR/AcrR family transcriptional regulator